MKKAKTWEQAWAIATGNGGGGFIGVLRFKGVTVSACQGGNMKALFRTRLLARAALKRIKGPADRGLYPNARVVRVEVLIEEV